MLKFIYIYQAKHDGQASEYHDLRSELILYNIPFLILLEKYIQVSNDIMISIKLNSQ